jgi:hypothetical protein
MAISVARRYVLHLADRDAGDAELAASANRVLTSLGSISVVTDSEGGHCVLDLNDGAVLGEAISKLTAAGINVLACREERSGIENAFLYLTRRSER